MRTLFLRGMTAGKSCAPDIERLPAPGFRHIVKLPHGALRAPDKEKRTADPLPAVRRVILEIDRCRCPVILADRVHRPGIPVAAKVFLHHRFFCRPLVMQKGYEVEFALIKEAAIGNWKKFRGQFGY